jgi:DNA-directed RNA polymerase II subunit RPB2
MGKQAIGVYASNFLNRMDTVGSVLTYPQKPIVYTRMSTLYHDSAIPNGMNAIVAVGCYTG